jgi:hypothetical protein
MQGIPEAFAVPCFGQLDSPQNGVRMSLTHDENLTPFIGDQGEVRVSRSRLATEPGDPVQVDLGVPSQG